MEDAELSLELNKLKSQVRRQLANHPSRHVEQLSKFSSSFSAQKKSNKKNKRQRRITLSDMELPSLMDDDGDCSSSMANQSSSSNHHLSSKPNHDSLEYNLLINCRLQYYKLFDCLSRTMRGEGNSTILLSGAHGTGKSALLEFALSQLALKFGKSSFISIHLNGRLESTDAESLLRLVNALSLNSIADISSGISDPSSSSSSSSLSLFHTKSRFSENIDLLVSELRKCADTRSSLSMDRRRPAVLVILDHCEEFAQRRQLKQTLLYNLFDTLASEHSRFCVVALSPHKSWTQFLEKRVSSRLELTKIVVGSDLDFAVFKRICFDALLLARHSDDDDSDDNDDHKDSNELVSLYSWFVERSVLGNEKLNAWLSRLHNCGLSPQELLVHASRVAFYALHLFEAQVRGGHLDRLKEQLKLQDSMETDDDPSHNTRQRRKKRTVVRGRPHTKRGRMKRNDEDMNGGSQQSMRLKITQPGMAVLEKVKKEECPIADWREQVLSELSVLQLLIVILACKMDHCGEDEFNFEQLRQRIKILFEESLEQALIHRFGDLQTLRAFRSLIKLNLLLPSNQVSSDLSGSNHHSGLSSSLSASSYSMSGMTNIEGNALGLRFEMYRLNLGQGTAADWLGFIQKLECDIPTWMREWLTRNSTYVHS